MKNAKLKMQNGGEDPGGDAGPARLIGFLYSLNLHLFHEPRISDHD
jgi:hypothetical protein